jgi:peptidoglycan/LPS O-acetylase OafA/YrhL
MVGLAFCYLTTLDERMRMSRSKFYSFVDQHSATLGHSSGFDYMRMTLSLSIVALHSCITGYGAEAEVTLFTGPARPLVRLLVPMFFALSGYLVAGSLERSKTLGMFLALRAIRIYPALVVEVILSALILGPIVTSLPPRRYFSDPLFFKYMLNALGDVQFSLPGVFERNPLPGVVNLQLWTIPFELYCYLTLAFIALLGLKNRRVLGPGFVVIITVTYLLVTLFRHQGEIVPVVGAINGGLLVVTFLAGVSIYFYQEMLPWNFWSGIGAIFLSMILLGSAHLGDLLAPVPVAYATVYLGLLNPSRRMLRGADYSYGIYLYGFVIQQTIVELIPAARIWYINMVISVPAAFVMAALSWHLVEKPAGRLRPLLTRLETKLLIVRQRKRAAQ